MLQTRNSVLNLFFVLNGYLVDNFFGTHIGRARKSERNSAQPKKFSPVGRRVYQSLSSSDHCQSERERERERESLLGTNPYN